jgi:iron complex outermembrane receptor protein
MRKLLLVLIMACSHVTSLCQPAAVINGTVKDGQTGIPLEGASLLLDGANHTTLSDRLGRFQLPVSTGSHRLTITYIGYLSFTKEVVVTESETTTVEATLVPDIRPANEVVVAAFLKPEKMYEAAAAIHVINRKAFERFAGSNPIELMATVPGIEYTRNGVADITFNARGLHTAFNNRLLQIVDGRNSMSPLSGTLPIMNRGTIIKDDIERLEVVLGPQSAIYGPNAHNAVFSFVTKDPRKHPGTSLSTSAGSRSQFSTRLRHAHVINSKWAYKLTGEQATGREYTFYDSVYAGNQNGNTPFYGPAVAIPGRIKDFGFKHIRGEGHLYYALKPGTDIILSGGSSEHTFLQVTTAGRNQMKGVVYSYVQAKMVSARWYASIYNTWGSLGNSYNVGGYTRDYWNRTRSTITSPNHPLFATAGYLAPDEAEANALRLGNRFKEKSRRLNAEVRYNYTFPRAGLFVALGANFQEERPNGYGITLIDSFQRIRVRQAGGAAQAEKHLPLGLRFIAATRFDHHQNFGGFLSPRLAVVKAVPQGAFRVSWSRAYSMPTIQNQYAGINRILFGNASGIFYLPNGERFSNEKARVLTTPLKPEQISTWEGGFKGTIVKNLYLDINYYNGVSKNFISPARTIGGRVFAVNGIPVSHNPATAGAVSNDTLKGASFSTSLNYGEVTAYGLDVLVRYALSNRISLQMNYSWFGSDITTIDLKNDANKDGYISLEETSLNAPRNRGLLALQYERILDKRWNATVSARFVERYDFYSGLQIGTHKGKGKRGVVPGGSDPATGAPRNYVKNFNHGPLGGFTTIDLSTGYEFNDNIRLNIGVTNLLNTEQVEFVGSPSIGRLVMAELRLRVW